MIIHSGKHMRRENLFLSYLTQRIQQVFIVQFTCSTENHWLKTNRQLQKKTDEDFVSIIQVKNK